MKQILAILLISTLAFTQQSGVSVTSGNAQGSAVFQGTTSGSTCLISTGSLPGGTVGTPYAGGSVTTNGCSRPLQSCTISGGALPSGLVITLASPNCIISGTPTQPQTASFTVKVIDNAGIVGTQALQIIVSAAVNSVGVNLPQDWPNGHMCDGARNTADVVETMPGTYPANNAGLKAFHLAAENRRVNNNQSSKLIVAVGTSITISNPTGGQVTWLNSGYTGTKCLFVDSSKPRRRGVMGGAIAIKSIFRQGGTVFVDTWPPNDDNTGGHGLVTGDKVLIQRVLGGTTSFNVGAYIGAYQGVNAVPPVGSQGVAVTVTGTTTFTYQQLAGGNESGTVMYPFSQVVGPNTLAQQVATNMWKIVNGTTNTPMILSAANAHDVVYANVEATNTPGLTEDSGSMHLGCGPEDGCTLASQYPVRLGFESSYFHACVGDGTVPTTIPIWPKAVNCGAEQGIKTEVRMYCGDCYFINGMEDQIVDKGFDGHAIGARFSIGPWMIDNNHIRGGATTHHYGGSPVPSTLFPTVSSDGYIAHNIIDRDPNWIPLGICTAGGNPNDRQWSIKNLTEFKEGQRILYLGNIVEWNYCDGQAGDMMLLTPRGDAAWFFDWDISIIGNTFSHAVGMLEELGRDQSAPAGGGAGFSMTNQRIDFEQNLILDLGNKFLLSATGGAGAIRIFPQGTGEQAYTCTANRNNAGIVTLNPCTCTTSNCPQTGVSTGDPIHVDSCSPNATLNTNAANGSAYTTIISSDPFTLGPITYQSAANAPVSGASCLLHNAFGWPNAHTYIHNTFVSFKSPGLNAPITQVTSPGVGQPRNFTAKNNLIIQNAGTGWVFCNTDGTVAGTGGGVDCFDESTFEFHHNVRANIGNTVNVANHRDWNPRGTQIALTTNYLNINPTCGGVVNSGCVGLKGDYNGNTYTDYRDFGLLPNSSYAAGNARQADDGKDMGADIGFIESMQTLNLFVCPSNCNKNGLSHGPYPHCAVGSPAGQCN